MLASALALNWLFSPSTLAAGFTFVGWIGVAAMVAIGVYAVRIR
jgi:hypothetical protein